MFERAKTVHALGSAATVIGNDRDYKDTNQEALRSQNMCGTAQRMPWNKIRTDIVLEFYKNTAVPVLTHISGNEAMNRNGRNYAFNICHWT
jgi:hypothetical protein